MTTAHTLTCVHYWNVEPAAGPTSKGTCRHCGKERVFWNIAPGYDDSAETRQGTSRLYNHRGPSGIYNFDQTYRVDEEEEE